MSEKKKVIYVNDLVIKADHVRVEPTRRPDPFFGPVRDNRRDDYREQDDAVFGEEDEKDHHEDDKKDDDWDENDDDEDKRENRDPFSWI
ncbi:hypothetical protein J416_13569 [Gracilibacillus halophilus YIM-C55.5]|uniref:Uncharacterized protein n=1 Tax=Gracilibacillus halophilus YIM-C55.5 TaxID=1308866 RepID=N4WRU0_9BACI|nr:hypothetical protein [Gracilibacillus halophilus]ENH95916.1 hypothetical protein J416_13569 [Gracilibacillus halophilus YIM-C55.5]